MRKRAAIFAAFAALFVVACGGGGGGGSGGGSSCNNTCATVGTKQCSGALVSTCVADTNGCRAWSAPVACGTSQICSSVSNSCVTDLCQGVSTNGTCASSTQVQFCGAATDNATMQVLSYTCPTGQQCQVQSGKATCVLVAACVDGQTQCANATTLQTCAGGAWVNSTCGGSCLSTAIGGLCGVATTTASFSGRLLFEYRDPNAGLTDWATTVSIGASRGMLIVSNNTNGNVYDAVYTSLADATAGQFTIKVPQTPTANDRITAIAAADDGAGSLAFAIADPGFTSPGTQSTLGGALGPSPRIWAWAWSVPSLTNGQDLTVTEAMGSGAANVHFNMIAAYLNTYAYIGHPGRSVVVWLNYGTSWDCGKCFAPVPITQFGVPFASQLWLAADSNQTFWSDAVTSHELGHWAMQWYGTSPIEGGSHFLGVPTFPGQAWSEGWATWFSSDMRQSPIYYDKQAGTFLWVDLSARQYGSGNPWVRPTASSPDGLLQMTDENEVASMLWSISNSSVGAAASIYSALTSPHMNTSPFKRGYTRHLWSASATGPTNVIDTGVSAPMIADFLDALDCASFSRNAIDAATQPSTYYPYPSASPLCP